MDALVSLKPKDLAIAAFQADNHRLAHRWLFEMLKQDPKNLRIWLLLGWTATTPSTSISYFKHILSMHPNHSLAMDGLAWAEEELSRYSSQQDQQNLKQSFSTTSDPIVNLGESTGLIIYPRLILSNLSHSHWNALRFDFYKILFSLLYIMIVAIAEILMSFISIFFGLTIHSILILTLLLHASHVEEKRFHKFLLALTLVPLIRIVSMSMPLGLVPDIVRYALIGLPLLLAVFLGMRNMEINWIQVGFGIGPKIYLQVLVALSGIGLGYLESFILTPAFLNDSLSWKSLLLSSSILLIFTGFLEELIFRGLLLRTANEVMGSLGILYTAILFAVLQIGSTSPLGLLYVFGIGLYFGVVVDRTKSIWGVALAHGLANIALCLIFPRIL